MTKSNIISDELVSEEYSRDARVPEFFGFTRGSTVFSLSASGVILSRRLVWPEEPAVATARTTQFSLPFTVEGLSEAPMIPVGLCIIVGGTGVGKSSFVRALARDMEQSKGLSVRRLITVEPHDDGDEVLEVPTYSNADSALAAAVAAEYAKKKKQPVLHVIDSLRAPLFETSGAAGSRGISMPFFTQITRVSNCLAKAGMTVLATINPMDEDPDYVSSFLNKLSASVPSMILLDRVKETSTGALFTGTVQMRPNRVARRFSFGGQSTPEAIRLVDLEFEPAPTNVRPLAEQRLVQTISSSPL